MAKINKEKNWKQFTKLKITQNVQKMTKIEKKWQKGDNLKKKTGEN